MPIWENAGARYLATLGIKAKPDLKERLDALSLPEGAIYMQKEYGLSVSAEDILEGVNQVVKDFYYKEAVMKPGAYALVKRLKENGVKLIIATATDKEMAKAALIRNGIWQDFTGMITCEEAGAGKTSPKVFELARQKLGTKKEKTWVFEDSLYAVTTSDTIQIKDFNQGIFFDGPGTTDALIFYPGAKVNTVAYAHSEFFFKYENSSYNCRQ